MVLILPFRGSDDFSHAYMYSRYKYLAKLGMNQNRLFSNEKYVYMKC